MRATWHPSVPAPSRRHFIDDKAFKFRDGKARHLISFKFKSAADMANLKIECLKMLSNNWNNTIINNRVILLKPYLVGSMDLARLIHLETCLPLFCSHPTAFGKHWWSLHPKPLLTISYKGQVNRTNSNCRRRESNYQSEKSCYPVFAALPCGTVIKASPTRDNPKSAKPRFSL